MIKRIECVVYGRVQLVMYRDFATRKAKSLGIVGSVRNMDDGKVFVIAEGEEEMLTTYIKKLQKGSVLSHVEQVTVVWSEPQGVFTNFTIVYK